MNGITLSFDSDWIPEDPDGSECWGCKENIYTRMYVFYFTIGGGAVETKRKLCETCYNLMEKTEEETNDDDEEDEDEDNNSIP